MLMKKHCQSTHCSDRVFLPIIKERKIVLHLITGEITMNNFLASEITSRNGRLLVDLIETIENILQNCLKNTPDWYEIFANPTRWVALCKLHSAEPLHILQSFCNQEFKIFAAENYNVLKLFQTRMPPLADMIVKILKLENTTFLPAQVSAIILQLLIIREYTFTNAAERTEESYIDWDDDWGSPPLSFYPNHQNKQI